MSPLALLLRHRACAWAVCLTISSFTSDPSILAQPATQTIYLHGSGGNGNPASLYLNLTPPSGQTAKFKDSAGIHFSGGNPWKAVGTWIPPAGASGSTTLQALTPLHVWLGLKNSDDQGTKFDLYAEVVHNGTALSSGLTRCITGVTRNANQAQEVTVPFSAFSPQLVSVPPDTVALRIWTRIGTHADNSFCGGHGNATGLRLYFDSINRPARLGATVGGAIPSPMSLLPNPLNVAVGGSGVLTATLSPAPAAPGALTVVSANAAIATVPSSVPYAVGQSSVVIPVQGIALGNAQITASTSAGQATSLVHVTAPAPMIASLLPAQETLTQGASGTLTVTISAAQSADTTVSLDSSAAGVASVPALVTTPAGQVSAPVPVSANSSGTATITASLNGSTATSTVTVTPALPTVVSLLPPTTAANVGATGSLTVTISATQSSHTAVAIAASPTGIITVPSTVTVPAGLLSTTVPFTALALGSAMIQASLNDTTADAVVQVTPPPAAIISLLPSPLTVAVGATGALTVTLNVAQPTDQLITPAVSPSGLVQLPPSVTVPAGHTEATFSLAGTALGTATVTAGLNGSQQSATVQVVAPPPTLVSLLPNPFPLQQGATGTMTVTISADQPTNATVPLTNSTPSLLQAPDHVIVPAGQTSATFAVTAIVAGTATLTATLNGSTASSTIQIAPPPPVLVSLVPVPPPPSGPLTLPKGVPGTLRVTIDRAATEATVIALASAATTAVTVPPTVTVPAGLLTADFPVMTVGEGSSVITASLNGSTATATVVVTPAVLVQLALAPLTPTIFVGQQQAFTAQGTFTDGQILDVTNTVAWSSSNTAVAIIGSTGLATGQGPGTATITAGGAGYPATVSASTTLTVQTPPALSLAPATATVSIGGTLTLTISSAVAAGPGGLTVTLTTSGTGQVTIQPSVVIPEGLTSADVPLTATAPGSVTVTASAPLRIPATSTLTIPVPPPTITGFSPLSGKLGDVITITGTNFVSVQAVTFNGVPASSFTVTSATTLIATVPATVPTGKLGVATAAGTALSAADFTAITLTGVSLASDKLTVPTGQGWTGRVYGIFSDGMTKDITGSLNWSSSNGGTASVSGTGLIQGVTQGQATITGTIAGFTVNQAVQVGPPSGPLPPDPVAVAPALNRTVPTGLADAVSFLYSGATPIQTGVSAGAIESTRVAVLRGIVKTRDGFPLPGVTITVLNHPEFGQTLTRPDGQFDLAVNGGGPLTLRYAATGFIAVQRQVTVPWQDYVVAPTVVMIPYDSQVTTMTMGPASPAQFARGSVQTDGSGTRQATLLFAAGTSATMTLPNGTTQPLTTMHVRATEFTVGPTGPQAMPGELPPNSGYTYAIEYSVDEAVAAGATRVDFTFGPPFIHQVVAYVDNFLGFPVGVLVPTGFYDTQQGRWVPSANGSVLKVLSITAGLADIDVNGDNLPDNSSLSSAERQALAGLYPAGVTLWRVPITHFSEVDKNWAFKPPPDATAANQAAAKQPTQNQDCTRTGSVIACESQALGESVGLTGTPHRLHYTSQRAAGNLSAYQLDIPLSGGTIPASLQRIELEVIVAGQTFTQSFAPSTNLRYAYAWNGLDAYGRRLAGRQPYTVRIGYVYAGVYDRTTRFGSFGTSVTLAQATRQEVILWQESGGLFSPWDAKGLGLGGWSLDAHHVFDPTGRAVYLGTGTRRSQEDLAQAMTISTAAGTGTAGFQGDGSLATAAHLNTPASVAIGPDRSVYIADLANNRIRRILPDGTLTTFAGGGSNDANGIPATQANLPAPTAVAVGPDGSVYVAENSTRIRRIGLDGLIQTVAGNGLSGGGGNGGPATSASVEGVRGVAVGPDGSLYIAENTNHRVRRVDPGGIITTIAGLLGTPGATGDNGPAAAARLNGPAGLALGRDGSLYVADSNNHRVRRIGIDGTITTVAGSGTAGFSGDGGLATSAQLNGPFALAVSSDGSLMIAERFNARVREVGTDRLIRTVVGTGVVGSSGDGGPALAGQLNGSTFVGLAMMPNGRLLIADGPAHRVRQVAPAFLLTATGQILIPAEDGSEVSLFDAAGRHLSTKDALTGANRWTFGYDANGRLLTVTDADNKVTTIERDGSGLATAIVASGGQRTTLTIDGAGDLAAIKNPNNETVQLTYAADGLLTTFRDARGQEYHYTYDTLGRLAQDQDPAGGVQTLTRAENPLGWTVAVSTALNRTTSYQTETLTTGDQRRRVTDPTGLVTTTVIGLNGTTTITAPDGTVTTQTQGPDPRWAMQAPVLKSLTVRTPSALTSTVTSTRAVTLSNPSDPLSLASQTDTLVINGRQYQSVFNQTAKTLTTTTPAGRTSTVTLDAKGRVVQEQVTGLEPVAYTYEALGRLSTITQGTGAAARTSTLTYNSKHELTALQDPLARTVGFSYDLAGRITTQTLPDTRQIGYAYDPNGNVTGLTPPGRPQHQFQYTPVDLEQRYTPPAIGLPVHHTQYSYSSDRQLTLVARPDGQTITLNYEPTGGRLSSLTLPGSISITYAYHPTAGTLSNITAPGSTLTYTYDGSLLTNTTWSGIVAGSVGRVYDQNFRITSQSVNGTNPVSFGYDNDSLLTSAGAFLITRHPSHGLITGTTLGVATDTRTYNTFGELSRYTAAFSSTPLFDVTYTRDKLGRITQKIESIGGTTDTYDYVYDLAGRLHQVTRNGTISAVYGYDSNGNRISYTTPITGTIGGVYDAQDRLTDYGQLQFTYTANGELLTKSNPSLGQTATYNYDVLGNLKSVILPGSVTIEYVIDGQNRRIGKKVNGTLVQGFLYQNQLNPVAELDGTGSIVSRFVYGTKANVPDYMVKGGVTYRIVSDHLGSPRLVVNASDGTIAQRLDYDEFGSITLDTSPGFQPFGFAGGLYDQQTGLVRFGARWTTKDPIKFAAHTTSLYEYVFGDPINKVDPTGLECPVRPKQKFDVGVGGTLGTQGLQCTIGEGCKQATSFPPEVKIQVQGAFNEPPSNLNPVNVSVNAFSFQLPGFGFGIEVSIGTYLFDNPASGPASQSSLQQGISVGIGVGAGLPVSIQR
jgi:RHS repeat-associated protein